MGKNDKPAVGLVANVVDHGGALRPVDGRVERGRQSGSLLLRDLRGHEHLASLDGLGHGVLAVLLGTGQRFSGTQRLTVLFSAK